MRVTCGLHGVRCVSKAKGIFQGMSHDEIVEKDSCGKQSARVGVI